MAKRLAAVILVHIPPPSLFCGRLSSPNGHGWALDNPVRTTTQWLTLTAGLGTQTEHFAGFRLQWTPPHPPANPDLTQICAKPVPSQPRQPYFLSCFKSQKRQLPSLNNCSFPLCLFVPMKQTSYHYYFPWLVLSWLVHIYSFATSDW